MEDQLKREQKIRYREESSHIRVHVRLKQSPEKEGATYNIFSNGTQLHVPNTDGRLELDKWYRFDHIYSPISSNKEVYKLSAYDLVESALNGLNTAVFAYGQTGSGKTRTLMSKDGVTAHIVSHMFHRIWKDVRRDYKVSLSYLQIYNEQIHDLLNPHGQLECTIREDATHGPYVENITKVVCETPMDAYDLINIGRKSVVLGETKMNRLSNRSHTVCQISIDRYKKDPRQKKKSMQETYTYVSDILAAQETESGIDFTTIPFNKENLKKRHSIAVAKINRRKSTKSDSVQTSTPKSLLSVPGHAKKRNSLRDDLLPSYPRRLRSKQNSPGGSFSDEASLVSKRASLPAKKASDEKPTMMDAIGVQNVERLQSIYRSSFDSDIDQSHDDRVESRGKYLYKSPSSMSSDFSYSDGSAIESESHYGTSECLETDGYVRENSASVFEEDKVAKASNEEENVVVKGKISIVDLAGSERFKTFADDERLKEAQNINLSLLELGNVISALTNEKQKHIPYRNSVLTRLLQESLGGNSKTTFLLCVSTKVNDMNEAKCTFEFGQKLKKVLTKPILNLDIDYRRKYHELLAKCERTEEEYQSMVDECKMLQKSAVEQEGDMNRTIEDQQLLMKSVQIEFDKVVTECMEANNKLDTFQEKLTATETMLDAKDEEISKLREDLIKALVNQHLSSETTVHSEDSELYNTANYNHVHIHDEITLNTDISDDNVALANIEDLKKSIYDADILQEDTDTVDAVYSISSFSNDTPHTTFTSPVSSVHINGNDDMDVPEKESCNFSDQPVASFDEESSIGETSIKNTEFESPKFLRVMRNHKKSLGTKKCDVACNTVAGNHIGNSSAPIIVTFLQSPRQTCEKVDDSNARSSTNFLVERHDVATNTLRDFESTKEPNKLSGDDLAMSKSSLLDIMFLDECYNQSQIYKLLRSENMDEIKSVLICELKELNMLSSRLEYLRHHRVGSSNENKEKMNTENSLLAINNSIDREDLSSMSFKNFTEINPDMALLIKDIFDDSHPSEERFNMLDEELKKQFHQVCDDNAANKKTSVVCIEDRALILQSYLWKCKESMHTDLLKTANELSNFVGSSEIIDASSECNVYESIIQLLSKEDLLTQPSIYLLRNMMHLLLSAYSVTVCLLVLSSKKSLDHSDAGINYIGRVNETGSSYNNNIESINRNLSNISVCDTTKSSSVYTSMDSVGMTTRRREPIDNDIEFTKKKPKKNRLSKLLCMPTKSKNIKKGTNKCEDKIQTSV